MTGKSYDREWSGYTKIVDHLHGLLRMQRKREYWAQSRRRWPEVAGLKEPLKITTVNVCEVSESEAFAKQKPNTTWFHNACTTQRGSLARLTPSTGPTSTKNLRLEARIHSRLLSFLFSRKTGADFHLHNRKYLFGFSDFDGKADGDKGSAREGQRNPINVVRCRWY